MKTEGAVEMVRRGYTEGTRCLNFQVAFYTDLDGVREAVRVIDSYNDFEAERVINAIEILDQGYLSPYGYIKVGRESSPVLYFDLTPDADHDLVEAILRAASADEVDVRDGTVRAWWD